MRLVSYILCFLPFIVSLSISEETEASYYLAWFGSIFLFYVSTRKWFGLVEASKPLSEQFFRPYLLSQFLFFFSTAVSTIFYFLEKSGYYYFAIISENNNILELNKLAAIQRMAVFGHGSFLAGLLLFNVDYRNLKTNVSLSVRSEDYFRIFIYGIIVGSVINYIPGLQQLSNFTIFLAVFSGLYYFINKTEAKQFNTKVIGVILLIFYFAAASGMKENVLLVFIFIGLNFLRIFGNKVLVILIPSFVFILYFYPTLNAQFRERNWYGGKSTLSAYQEILTADNLKEIDFEKSNWEFLTKRLTEVSMTVKYFDFVPNQRPFYGFDLLENSGYVFVPRIVWPTKPSPDETSQKRAKESGALIANSNVDPTSAKPQTLSDAWMSGAEFGVLFTFFILGFLAQLTNVSCEKYFGGYAYGSVVAYHSFFSIFNKGGCFENLAGAIYYGFLGMFIVQFVFIKLGYLEKTK